MFLISVSGIITIKVRQTQNSILDQTPDMIEHPEEKATAGPMEALPVAAAKKSSRRPDIDVIKIVLTWLIMVYHTLLIYCPDYTYNLKIIPETGVDFWMYIIYFGFIKMLNVWNMPMFFFLSGIRKGNILAQ